MLKRVISLIVGVACLVSMTGVFAASYSGTTTTYVSDGTIKVDTTITGTTGQVATYLVYDEDLNSASAITNGSEIVYVDQYKFVDGDNGSKTFSYQTSSANIGAKVAVGADVEGTVERGNVEGITVVYNGSDQTTKMDPLPEDATAEEWVLIPCVWEGNITEVKLSGTADGLTSAPVLDAFFVGADGIWVIDSSIPANITTLYVQATVDSAKAAASTIGMTYYGADAVDTRDVDANGNAIEDCASLLVVGSVTGVVSEYGIILAKSEAAAEAALNTNGNYITGTDVVKLEALGKNNAGKFAVRVYDDSSFVSNSTWYAVTYYLNDNGYQAASEGKFITIE